MPFAAAKWVGGLSFTGGGRYTWGHKGGTAVKDKYGPDYYSAIGKKRWEGRARQADAAAPETPTE